MCRPRASAARTLGRRTTMATARTDQFSTGATGPILDRLRHRKETGIGARSLRVGVPIRRWQPPCFGVDRSLTYSSGNVPDRSSSHDSPRHSSPPRARSDGAWRQAVVPSTWTAPTPRRTSAIGLPVSFWRRLRRPGRRLAPRPGRAAPDRLGSGHPRLLPQPPAGRSGNRGSDCLDGDEAATCPGKHSTGLCLAGHVASLAASHREQ